MTTTRLPDLPLVYESDAYLIELGQESERIVRILRLLVFPDNRNGEPKFENFMDLAPSARRAVIEQVNRRYPGRTVKV